MQEQRSHSTDRMGKNLITVLNVALTQEQFFQKKSRILHYKDVTGFEIERALLKQVHNSKNITIYDYYFANLSNSSFNRL